MTAPAERIRAENMEYWQALDRDLPVGKFAPLSLDEIDQLRAALSGLISEVARLTQERDGAYQQASNMYSQAVRNADEANAQEARADAADAALATMTAAHQEWCEKVRELQAECDAWIARSERLRGEAKLASDAASDVGELLDKNKRLLEERSRLSETRKPYSDECNAAIIELERRFESESVELVSIEHLARWVDQNEELADKLVSAQARAATYRARALALTRQARKLRAALQDEVNWHNEAEAHATNMYQRAEKLAGMLLKWHEWYWELQAVPGTLEPLIAETDAALSTPAAGQAPAGSGAGE